MCSITGFVSLDGQPYHPRGIMAQMLIRAETRGKDSWGVATQTQWLGGPGRAIDIFNTLSPLVPSRWAIGNNRAEPTTERQAVKDRANIQPFGYRDIVVSHNGTIANDKQLAERYGFDLDTTIDSAVLAPLIDAQPADDLAMKVMNALHEVVGSYAIAVGRGDEVVLACNYRPLYLRRDGDLILFASQPEFFGPDPFLQLPTMAVPPYSLVRFADTGPQIEPLNLVEEGRVLAVCSGGLDSTVAATQMVRDGRDVTLVHFNYSCRAEARELVAVHDVAFELGIDVIEVDMRHLFREVIGGSPLTNSGATFADGEAGAEFAHEWVPARNLIMLAVATGIAESKGFTDLVLGNNIEEAGAYPDNEQEFIRLLNNVMPYAVAADKQVRIQMPVGGMSKREIVALGHKLNAPIAASWSCYEGRAEHCGQCGPCYMRHHAHTMEGLVDPTTYEVTP